jgi:hypothetical protein
VPMLPLLCRPAIPSPQLPNEFVLLTLVSLPAVVSANLRIEFKCEGLADQDSVDGHDP